MQNIKYWIRFLPELKYVDGDISQNFNGSEKDLVEKYLEGTSGKVGGHWLAREVNGFPTVLCYVTPEKVIGISKGIEVDKKWGAIEMECRALAQ